MHVKPSSEERGSKTISQSDFDGLRLKQQQEDERLSALRHSREQQVAEVSNTADSCSYVSVCVMHENIS